MHVLRRKTAVREGSVEEEVWVQFEIWKVPARADIVDEHLIVLTEILVHAYDTLIGRQLTLGHARIIHHSNRVRQRHVFVYQRHGNRIQAAGRNNVPGKWGAIQRIYDLRADG